MQAKMTDACITPATRTLLFCLVVTTAHSCSAFGARSVARLVWPIALSERVRDSGAHQRAAGEAGDGLPHPSLAGYLTLRKNASMPRMYYAFYEAFDPSPHLLDLGRVPLVLWLQVRAPVWCSIPSCFPGQPCVNSSDAACW